MHTNGFVFLAVVSVLGTISALKVLLSCIILKYFLDIFFNIKIIVHYTVLISEIIERV